MRPNLERETRVLRQGDHICFFYRDMEEQLAGLVPFVAYALASGEQCMCVQHPSLFAPLLEGLKSYGIRTDEEVARGALVLCDMDQVYLEGGSFNPDAMEAKLRAFIKGARESGYKGVRTAGDLAWLKDHEDLLPVVLHYEEAMQRLYESQGVIGFCQYPASLLSALHTHRVLKTHAVAFLKDERLPHHCLIRFRNQLLYADIISSGKPADSLRYHYVVQREGSADVLAWGHSGDFRAARRDAEAALEQFNGFGVASAG